MRLLRAPGALRVALAVVTALSMWLTSSRLRLSSDLTDMFPNRGEAAMLTRFLRAFGGGDLAFVLIRGADPESVEAAANDLSRELAKRPTVARVLDAAPLPKDFDPMLAWRYAMPAARDRLARALTPEGMRDRLDGTRELLLAPGSADIETWLARDPLRLAMLPWEGKTELAAGLNVGPGGLFVADGGRARLVVAEPRGSAFDGDAAKRFVSDARAAMAAARGGRAVDLDLTGGHAIAVATAEMLERDMILSGALSTVLASLTFLLTFRRLRALFAVLPPLGLGTLWTTGLAALSPAGLSAIATAFAAVVIGVGVDTGVHVYAALLEGRRRGLSPRDAAAYARASTWRPTILAACAAGLAFASLAVSELTAVRQLGLLCGAGEVLTAIGILLITPEIGALLERRDPPAVTSPRWIDWVASLTATRGRALAALCVALSPILVLAVAGSPEPNQQLVAIRSRAIEPLRIQSEIYRVFGSKEGQWLVVSADASMDRAAARADAVAEALDRLTEGGTVAGFDALASFAPAPDTQRARLAARDALDLPSRRDALASALADRGFDAEACAPALDALARADHDVQPLDPSGPLAFVISRHIGKDGPDVLAVSYVRPSGDPAKDARAIEAIHAADPGAVITGYHHLETALRATLAHDLPIVAVVALVLVVITLRAILRRAGDVVLALATIAIEVFAVAAVMRVCHVRWHVYDALVLPVLIGITMDESMFLLHAARATTGGIDAAIRHALRQQGPLVVATGLTTAAGFGALLACKFEGLFDLGAVGALGSALGLVAALVVVPAGLRLSYRAPPVGRAQ